MARCRGRWLIVLVTAAFLSVTPAVRAVEQTVVLQLGLDGYSGVADTDVETNDWDTPPQYTVNYGQNEVLHLDRDGGANVLIRFDLSAIPSNAAVRSATLELYNTTDSSGHERRIEAFRVLADWDEGNQVASPIDEPGKHGATGDDAFDWWTGEGTDVPWHARGLEAGTDYDAAVLDTAAVTDEGWSTWDVTATVQAWVRGSAPNHGLVLRDATGWVDGNPDWRDFVSSQSGDAAHRPVLRIVYDPDTPMADAGPDQEELHWDGGPITLDGSGSHDHPGGDDATLQYSWRVVRSAFGASLAGEVCTTAVCTVQPDAAGDWTFELVVTNAVGSSAADTVRVHLLSIPAGHPRLLLTPEKLAALRARAVSTNPRWTALLGQADASDGDKLAKALVRQVLDEPSYCSGTDGAIAMALAEIQSGQTWSTQAGDIALVYDWCHGELSQTDRDTILDWFATVSSDGDDIPGWGNYWPRWGYSFAFMGLAALGEAPDARSWMDEFRENRFGAYDVDNLDRIAAGGGWPEGTVYDWIANLWRVKAAAGWRTATGENLFEATAWFRERLAYLPTLWLPGTADSWGHLYHPYIGHGDAERNRGPMADYGRIMAEILVEAFPDDPDARALQGYLAAPPVDRPDDFLAHEEFLFFDPDLQGTAPSATGHLAAGTGEAFFRSGWPAGAGDDSTDVTVIQFHCGDRFSYHQHYEQGAFTLFSGEPLLLDSGVYSGEGLSSHDVNYYVRTVAHNTLVVSNPSEDLTAARPDAVSNDGGQRPPYPGTRAPTSVAYLEEHAPIYETGDLLAWENGADLGYVRGDATAAYNSTLWAQADHTDLPGNVAKVSRFHRELVYLRADATRPGEAVVLYDRVGVTDPSFSGENTKLLFHTLRQPVVDGPSTNVSPGEILFTAPSEAVATAPGGARVTLRFVLPASRHVRRVGGRGEKSFWVFDANYDWHWSSNEPQPRPVNDFEDTPWGEWRLELEPADTGLDHRFLTAILPDRTGTSASPATTAVSGTGVEGALLRWADGADAVLFAATDDGAPLPDTVEYTVPSTVPVRHTVVDAPPGSHWNRTVTSGVGTRTVTLTRDGTGELTASDAGVLRFTTPGPIRCDVVVDGLCDCRDLAGEIRALTDTTWNPGGDPDVDGDGHRTAEDLATIVDHIYGGGR